VDISTILIAVAVAVAVVLVLGAGLFWAQRRRVSGELPRPQKLTKAASALGVALRGAWATGLDERSWEAMEEALIAADVGVRQASEIVSAVRGNHPADVADTRRLLGEQLRSALGGKDRAVNAEGTPAVVLVVGVNGTGKTTTIAKLAAWLVEDGKSVLLAAADTFRAGAREQLGTWGDRVGVGVVGGQQGGDPASVVYDALESARAHSIDVLIVDTAGRLHGNKNLMAELEKIYRVAGGGEAVSEVLLVLDATAGQNGLAQAKEFAAVVPVSGVVLTKLDGTARGGIVVAIEHQLDMPIKLVGLGEGMGDLEPFDPDSFVTELLERS
jgi:fused signal recognition particle receptor